MVFRTARASAAYEHSLTTFPARGRINVHGVALVATLVVLVVVGSFPESALAAGSRTWTGTEVLAQLRTRPFVERAIAIRGNLDFRQLKDVTHPFSCANCRLEGSLIALDTTFERTFDVSGAQILGRVQMNRATFRGPAVFGSPPGDRDRVRGCPRD